MVRDESGRFTDGNEGGPGRPKGSLDVLAAIRRKLETCPENEKRTYLDKLVEQYIENTLENSDGTAIRDLIDRFNGKPLQTANVNVFQEENPVYEAIKELRNAKQKTT